MPPSAQIVSQAAASVATPSPKREPSGDESAAAAPPAQQQGSREAQPQGSGGITGQQGSGELKVQQGSGEIKGQQGSGEVIRSSLGPGNAAEIVTPQTGHQQSQGERRLLAISGAPEAQKEPKEPAEALSNATAGAQPWAPVEQANGKLSSLLHKVAQNQTSVPLTAAPLRPPNAAQLLSQSQPSAQTRAPISFPQANGSSVLMVSCSVDNIMGKNPDISC